MEDQIINSGNIGWRSPSNIALIKYWGKLTGQIPMNPSLSFTLSNSFTETHLQFKRKTKINQKACLKFYFENELNVDFQNKIVQKLESFPRTYDFLNEFDLEIHSVNSFPHSAGIASSASSMSALALCLVSMKEMLFGPIDDFYNEASNLARIASGSASRSVYPSFALWGKSDLFAKSSDFFAIPFGSSVQPIFKHLQDTILIVDDVKKSVSSSAGHELMNNHPFKNDRIKQANNHLEILKKTLENGNWNDFSKLIENEALSLHALMMSSNPWFILLKPNTFQILEKIRKYREVTNCKISFTIDAGPNVHVIYPEKEKVSVENFIQEELLPLCKENQVIYDQLGSGPQRIS